MKGMAINRNSIGVVWINGKPYTYNADKLLTNRIEFNDAVNGVDTKMAKRRIYIRRR